MGVGGLLPAGAGRQVHHRADNVVPAGAQRGQRLPDPVQAQPGLDLQRLHDQVWVNGNVPIALLRWELLGLTDELAALDVDAG